MKDRDRVIGTILFHGVLVIANGMAVSAVMEASACD
jgi:hypothetical protein